MAESSWGEQWAVVELMGRRRVAGLCTEVEQFGARMLRVDIPGVGPDGAPTMVTQLYGGSAIYCLTPTTEQIARSVAGFNEVRPVHAYELPRLPQPTAAPAPQPGDQTPMPFAEGPGDRADRRARLEDDPDDDDDDDEWEEDENPVFRFQS